jgi:hypothetical protein
MVAASSLAIFVVPVLFVLITKISMKVSGTKLPAEAGQEKIQP